ncbi:MAG: Uma2 family endonuclease, partial [Nocardioidaceae bacterium]
MSTIALDRLEPWRFEDLWELPDELARRCEIVDGVLNVSPPPSQRHEVVVDRLHRLLASALGDDFAVFGSAGVDLGDSHRIPDLVVVHRTSVRPAAHRVLPRDVVLAVEVVSPTSTTTDRVTKPAQYAAAGIGTYWRVEPDEPGLTAYRLSPGDRVYTQVGRWGAGE